MMAPYNSTIATNYIYQVWVLFLSWSVFQMLWANTLITTMSALSKVRVVVMVAMLVKIVKVLVNLVNTCICGEDKIT